MVRKTIGARLTGTDVVQRVQSTYIHAPQLKDMIVQKPAWMTMSLNPRRCGTTVAIDGKDNWLMHNHLAPDEIGQESLDDRLPLGSDHRPIEVGRRQVRLNELTDNGLIVTDRHLDSGVDDMLVAEHGQSD